MKKAKKIALAMTFCIAASSSFTMTVNAEEAEKGEVKEYQLPPVLVQAQKDKEELPGGFIYKKARNGILGSADIMDIPFTQFSYTEKTIETFGNPSLPLNNILINNPSIRTSSTSPMYTDFSIRGINANGNHIYFNGVPNLFAQFLTPPNHIIGNIDVMSGPNTVLNGSTTSVNGVNGNTAPNGIISIMSKRATADPITRYTQTFSGRSSFGEYIDISRRFGKNNAWGIRVNAGHLDGDLAVPGMGKKERTFFLNLDHSGRKSYTNLFGGHFDIRVTGGQRWFNPQSRLGASTGLVSAPDSKRSFDYDGQEKVQHGYIFTFNHEQKFDDRWEMFVNLGMTDRSGYKYDNQGGSLGLIGQTGEIRDNLLNMVEANRNEYAQLGIKHKLQMGEVTNNISFAMDWSGVKNYSRQVSSANTIIGDLWNGVHATGNLPTAGKANLLNKEITKSFTLADHIEYKKLGVILALQRRDNQFHSFNADTGALTEKNSHVATTPSYAITYKPTEQVSVYASHSESYTRARAVGTAYANQGEVIKPVKNKQNEIGVKYQNKGFLTTLSVFQVDQRSYREAIVGGSTFLKGDGKSDYKGIEWNINGKIAPKWNLMGGFMYLDAKRKDTQYGTYDGFYVQGVAKWSGVMAAEYAMDDRNSIIGRMVYSGPAYVTDGNKVKSHLGSHLTLVTNIKQKSATYLLR